VNRSSTELTNSAIGDTVATHVNDGNKRGSQDFGSIPNTSTHTYLHECFGPRLREERFRLATE